MRLFLVCLLSFLTLSTFAAQTNQLPGPSQEEVRYSSALNIPTPTYQQKTYRFDGFYAGGNFGAAMPGGGMESNFNTGFDFVGQLGYQIQQARVELSPIYINNDGKSGYQPVSLYALMLNGYYDFPYSAVPILPRLTPYIGAGAGFIRASKGQPSVNLPATQSVGWGFQAIGGLSYRITLNWYAQADYRFVTWPDRNGDVNLFNIGFTYHF